MTIPYDSFEESIYRNIEEGKTPHISLTNALRDSCGTGRRFKPIAQIHPYDPTPTDMHPMQFFRTFKALKRVNGPLNKPLQDKWQRFLTQTFTQGEPIN